MRDRVRSPWTARPIHLLCLLCALLLPSFASAQSSQDLIKAIRTVMEEGQGLYVGAKCSEAAKVFEDGYAKHPYSAFLFNAGICYSKLQQIDKALDSFDKYTQVDPSAPDIEDVRERIRKLEAAKAAVAPPPVGDGGVDGAAPPPADAGKPPTVEMGDDASAMRSLVVIETEPPGAPLKLFAKTPSAGPFRLGGANAGWKEVANARAPANLTLALGKYHVVVEKFRDFNESETDIDVAPGRVLHFKANLSQGAFMGFLRVAANVRGAYVYLDDPEKKRPEWGTTPYGELIPSGEHQILVEAPGFQPLRKMIAIINGEQKEIEIQLDRVDYGLLRVKPRLTGQGGSAKVKLDEEPLGAWNFGEAPFEARVPSGRHRLTVEADGHKDYDGIIDVPRGQVLPITVTMIPSYPRGAAWTLSIIGAAFIGASAYFGNESNNLFDEIENDRRAGVLEADDERLTRGQWYAASADMGFAVGGVLGILAIYNFIKDPYPESASKVDQPVEFDDPRKKRPTARGPRREYLARASRSRALGRRTSAPGLVIGPTATDQGAGLVIGGSF